MPDVAAELANRGGGAIGCILASPLMAAVAVVVRVALGRPVLFRQERAGQHGRPFVLYKFRTMRAPRYEGEPDEPRLGPVGSRLRATSLDELPGLFNVVRGDIRLVGPRPLPPAYTERYSADQRRRLDVKPGLTGLVQTRGRNTLTWDEKLKLDAWYVQHRSWKLDLRILAATPLAVLRARGIRHSGHATMPVFEGPTSRDQVD